MPSPTPSILERDGCPIHYWLHGPERAPAIALLHGAGMDHRMFDAQVEALADDYRVLTWDARGHGRSQPIHAALHINDFVGDLMAILDREGIEGAVIGGQSFGGYIAQHVCLRHPSRVRALIVIGATGVALPMSRADMLGLRLARPLMRLWPYASFARTVARSTAVRPEVQAYARAALLQIPKRGFSWTWAAVEGAISREGIAGYQVEVPLLVMHGDRDDLGTIRRDAPRWRESEPGMVFLEVPDAGHNANQDNPEFVNQALRDFLARGLE